MKVRTDEHGFSLIELMLVVVIFSIMAGTMMPGVSSILSRQDVAGSTEKIRGVFEFTRSQAAVLNVAHQVILSPEDGDSGGKVSVYKGTSTSCVFDSSNILVRELELVSIIQGDVSTTDGSTPGMVRLPTTTRITSISPGEISEDGICFRPDGSVRDADTNLPVIADPAGNYGAGDVLVVLQDHVVTGSGAESSAPIGTPLRILIPYSGIARVTF
jgi:prepilin-type N-terminal cleavage/methylation domain-containing protein